MFLIYKKKIKDQFSIYIFIHQKAYTFLNEISVGYFQDYKNHKHFPQKKMTFFSPLNFFLHLFYFQNVTKIV